MRNGGALAGIRVVDLTINVLGPLATQVLGDAGADVIKVEAPGGDPTRDMGPTRTQGMAPMFLNLNRNKRSIVLDLKQPGDRRILDALVTGADVFVHNMRIGAATRLGLDPATLRADHPRLIHAAATGFRPSSALRDKPAFDDVIQGMSGVAGLNRDSSGAPRYTPVALADKFCGHTLASAIVTALFHRERTGEGQEVHVPMLETMLAFNLPEHLWGATLCEPELGLGYSRMLSPHRRPYPTADGHICVMAVTDDQWHRLFGALGRPELIRDPRFAKLADRVRNIGAAYEVLLEVFPTRGSAHWLAALDRADVPCGPANSIADLLEDTYLAEGGFFHEAVHPTEGRLKLLSPPVTFSASPTSIRRLPPKLGEHTEELLRELNIPPAPASASE
ncbi:MAG: carnitine dehydratase [Rhodospirillales bacterium 69-11]|nr:MAG: carnitine dehydratase [Rhodospirillales bacterium 69-11]